MKIKRLKRLKVNSFSFIVKWDSSDRGASFDYFDKKLNIGVHERSDEEIFMLLCHELWEIVACELNVRLNRPDCNTDYVFVYDHRQHETLTNMFAGLLSQFIA